MEYFAQLLRSLINDPLIFKLIFTSIVAAATFIFCLGVLYLISTVFNPVRRRLHLLSSGEISTQEAGSGYLSTTLEPLAGLTMPKKDWERSKISQALVHAGFRAPNAITGFYAIKTILIILFARFSLIFCNDQTEFQLTASCFSHDYCNISSSDYT